MREVDGQRGPVEGAEDAPEPAGEHVLDDGPRTQKRQRQGRSGRVGEMAAESSGQLNRCHVLGVLVTRGRRVRPNVDDALAATDEHPVDNE